LPALWGVSVGPLAEFLRQAAAPFRLAFLRQSGRPGVACLAPEILPQLPAYDGGEEAGDFGAQGPALELLAVAQYARFPLQGLPFPELAVDQSLFFGAVSGL
jgi:hypothetical protein